MALPLIPFVLGGGLLYALWKSKNATQEAFDTAGMSVKLANDLATIYNKTVPASVTAERVVEIVALKTEASQLYERLQATIKPYAPNVQYPGINTTVTYGLPSYDVLRKALLNWLNSHTLRSALVTLETSTRDLGERFEKACPECGKTATEPYGSDRPVSLLKVAVYGGLAVGAGYLALQTYKAFTHDDTYPRARLPRYAGGK